MAKRIEKELELSRSPLHAGTRRMRYDGGTAAAAWEAMRMVFGGRFGWLGWLVVVRTGRVRGGGWFIEKF